MFSATAQTPYPLLDLTITNGSAIARTQEPAVVGVPVPAWVQLYSTAGVGLVDAALQPVPVQFRVLSRWGGDRDDGTKPIKWVLAEFLADCPPNGTAVYRLAVGVPAASGGMTCSVTANAIDVWTSPTTHFVVNAQAFTLFDAATVGGTATISGPGALVFTDSSGSPVAPVVTSTTLEEFDPVAAVRAVVRQAGQIGTLRFTCRWIFSAGRSDVEVLFRLENPAAYGLFASNVPDGQVYFDALGLSLPIGLGALTAVADGPPRSVPSGGGWQTAQTFAWTSDPTNVPAGFSFTETIGGAPVASGGRSVGACDVSRSNGGVSIAVDRYWKNFPKAFRVAGGAAAVDLWPSFGNGPEYEGQYAIPGAPGWTPDPLSLVNYRYEGGRWKTHRAVFDFHATGPRTTQQTADFAARVNAPLVGRAPGPWIRMSGALGVMWFERPANGWTDPVFARYEKFFDICGDDLAADPDPNGVRYGLNKFMEHGGTNGGAQNYGWESFGDLTWTDGYSSLHYDLPWSVLSGFYRTGDYRLFDRGRDLAAYRRDYGQNHGTNVGEAWRGAQFYEKGFWHGNFSPGEFAHNWIRGLVLHYVMTGDEGSREAALENLAFIMRSPPGNWSGLWGSRIPGQQIDCLVDGYNFLGDPAWLAAAGAGVARYETIELGQGGNGYVLNLGSNPQATKPWMENQFFIAAAHWALAAGDASHNALLARMTAFFQNTCIIPASGPPNALMPASVYYEWSPTYTGPLSVHLCWPMLESLAYAGAVLGDATATASAASLFASTCRYWQTAPGQGPFNANNPATWSGVTFKPAQYPGTESKALSNVLLWGPGYVALQAYLNGQW